MDGANENAARAVKLISTVPEKYAAFDVTSIDDEIGTDPVEEIDRPKNFTCVRELNAAITRVRGIALNDGAVDLAAVGNRAPFAVARMYADGDFGNNSPFIYENRTAIECDTDGIEGALGRRVRDDVAAIVYFASGVLHIDRYSAITAIGLNEAVVDERAEIVLGKRDREAVQREGIDIALVVEARRHSEST